MTEGVVLLVPVLNRPGNVAPLMESIQATTPGPFRVLWLCDPGDIAQQDAIAKAGGWMVSPGGSYASKCNVGTRLTDEPFVVFAADDVVFHPGWLEAGLDAVEAGAHVVGLNDLIDRPRRPEHATHFLLTRAAAELPCIDGRRGPLCERYQHWRTDDELIATAHKRGMYRFAEDAVVEHRHPMTGAAPDDETYRKGRSSARLDNATFARRMRLWA